MRLSSSPAAHRPAGARRVFYLTVRNRSRTIRLEEPGLSIVRSGGIQWEYSLPLRESIFVMANFVQGISTIDPKGRATVPKAVRQALGVSTGDQIAFQIEGNSVSVRRVEAMDTDPAIGQFLAFLAKDIQAHPDKVTSMAPALRARIGALTQDMDIDFNASIDGEVDL